MNSIGDLASLMMATRQQSNLRFQADASAQAATTGVAQDKAQHLFGQTLSVSLLDRKITLLEQEAQLIGEADTFVSTVQNALDRIGSTITDFTNDLALASQVETNAQFELISENASRAFVDVVNTLNAQVAGKSVFSGGATDTPPLPEGRALLNDLRASIGAAPDAATLSNSIDAWFDLPTGPFQATAYQGSNINNTIPVGVSETAEIQVTANSEALRNTLKSLAKSALLDEISNVSPIADYRIVTSDTQAALLNNITDLNSLQGTLGVTQEKIALATVMNADALSNSQLQKSELVSVDQFESASRFEAFLQQLDVSYRIAARVNETSLTAYLR